MPSEISLIFVGGVADSGKSILIDKVNELIEAEENVSIAEERISHYLKEPLGWPPDKRLTSAASLKDWKIYEERAISQLCESIKTHRTNGVKCIIINTHFATYSPGGFMIGLDPSSLKMLCDACNLLEPESSKKAAVVLADISISDVSRKKEESWKDQGNFSTTQSLMDDLEFNRLYALQYFNTLSNILKFNRVMFQRISVNWRAAAAYPTGDENFELNTRARSLIKIFKESGFFDD